MVKAWKRSFNKKDSQKNEGKNETDKEKKVESDVKQSSLVEDDIDAYIFDAKFDILNEVFTDYYDEF